METTTSLGKVSMVYKSYCCNDNDDILCRKPQYITTQQSTPTPYLYFLVLRVFSVQWRPLSIEEYD